VEEHVRPERWTWLAEQADGLRQALRRRYPADQADDLTHDALLRAEEASSVPKGSPGAWLQRIARNLAVDRWRSERRLVALETAVHVPAREIATARDIVDAVRRLRRSDRVLLTRLAAGARYAELARIEGVGPSVIRQRAARARARVLAHLMEEKQ
jgi:DNA-directed RNA polymerase specialized sigma24 family protein